MVWQEFKEKFEKKMREEVEKLARGVNTMFNIPLPSDDDELRKLAEKLCFSTFEKVIREFGFQEIPIEAVELYGRVFASLGRITQKNRHWFRLGEDGLPKQVVEATVDQDQKTGNPRFYVGERIVRFFLEDTPGTQFYEYCTLLNRLKEIEKDDSNSFNRLKEVEKEVIERRLKEIEEDFLARVEAIKKALKKVGIKESQLDQDSWFSIAKSWYKHFENVSPEEMYKELKKALELTKKYYTELCDFDVKGYELAKRAEELGLYNVVKRIRDAGEFVDFNRLKTITKLKEEGLDDDLIVAYYTRRQGERFVPVFSFSAKMIPPLSIVGLFSEDVKEVLKEVASEEGVDEKSLAEKVKELYYRKIGGWWGKHVNYSYVKHFYDVEFLKLAVVPKIISDREVVFYGVFYSEKENWDKVREKLKEEVRQVALEMQRESDNLLSR